MNQQPLTPQQQNQVKKAKITLWVGIVGIIIIGLLITVYFVFLREVDINKIACSSINDYDACNSRTNCVPVVTSTCNTEWLRAQKCGEQSDGPCLDGLIFERCVNLVCEELVDTSNWNTYINTQYGFQFKYPSNWQLSGAEEHCPFEELNSNIPCTNDIVILNYLSDYNIYISHQGKNPDNLSVKEWLNQVKGQPEDFGYELKYDKTTGITLAGLDPAVYQGAITLYFLNGDDVFGIEWFDNEKKNEAVFKIFNAILLSFEFSGQ